MELNAPTISNSSSLRVTPKTTASSASVGSADARNEGAPGPGGGRGGAATGSSVFSPIVKATCRTGIMTIKVETLDNFIGVVHSRDYRKPKCSGYGENTKVTFLRVNMHAERDTDDYCGVFYNDPASEERSVAIAIRTHRTLELVGDKFYMITCGKAGFQNSRSVGCKEKQFTAVASLSMQIVKQLTVATPINF